MQVRYFDLSVYMKFAYDVESCERIVHSQGEVIKPSYEIGGM